MGVLALEISVYQGDPVPGSIPLFRKVYARREPLPQRTAAAVVAAWDAALASIMKELGADLAAEEADRVLDREDGAVPLPAADP